MASRKKIAPYDCPVCGRETNVTDVRPLKLHNSNIRRRLCQAGHKFSTYEIADTDYKKLREVQSAKNTLQIVIKKIEATTKKL
jgi:transcriptional regulator NrdR family protein